MRICRTNNALLVSDFTVGSGSSTLVIRRTTDKSTLVGLAIKLHFTVSLDLTFYASVAHTNGLAGIGFTVCIDHTETCFELASTRTAVTLLVRQTVCTSDASVTLAICDITSFLRGIGCTVCI